MIDLTSRPSLSVNVKSPIVERVSTLGTLELVGVMALIACLLEVVVRTLWTDHISVPPMSTIFHTTTGPHTMVSENGQTHS